MSTNKKYLVIVLATVLIAGGVTAAGIFSKAQWYSPISCSANPSSASIDQSVIFTASGGNGVYNWSGQNVNIFSPTGNQITVRYPSPGTYTVSVNSAGQSTSCNVSVGGYLGLLTNLQCYPVSQSAVVGNNVNFTASGGNGNYVWYSPDVTITNPYGAGFSANFGTPGQKTVTVSSGGSVATCTVSVTQASYYEYKEPYFPNTGGGFGAN